MKSHSLKDASCCVAVYSDGLYLDTMLARSYQKRCWQPWLTISILHSNQSRSWCDLFLGLWLWYHRLETCFFMLLRGVLSHPTVSAQTSDFARQPCEAHFIAFDWCSMLKMSNNCKLIQLAAQFCSVFWECLDLSMSAWQRWHCSIWIIRFSEEFMELPSLTERSRPRNSHIDWEAIGVSGKAAPPRPPVIQSLPDDTLPCRSFFSVSGLT